MKYLVFILITFLLGCSATTKQPHPATQRVIARAEQAGFSHHRYHTDTFVLTAYERACPLGQGACPVESIHVYIEGDGNSWKTKYQLSEDPTPKQPLALSLAMRDPHPHVVYLARPCQYTPHSLDKHCDAKHWSSHRYAPEVIAAMSQVLEQLKAKNPTTHFLLIGFSGGASVAALLAAQRNDVTGLITVAGDLNHTALNEYHHTTPLQGSLNPIKVASKLKTIPQHHYTGSRDKIVPPWVAQQFAKAVNSPDCVKVMTLKGVSHHQGWENKWETLVNQPLTCHQE